MREIYKPYSLKGKKQMKTTTLSIALLVAATMIISSAFPAIATKDNSTKMNIEKIEESIPKTISDPNAPQSLFNLDAAHSYNQQNNQGPLDIWDEQFYIDSGGESGSLYLLGTVFDGEYIYESSFNSATFYYWDMDLNFMGSFVPSGLGTGIIDLCWDPNEEVAWGAAYSGYTLYKLDLKNQEVLDTISLPASSYNVAYDSDDDAFWIGQWSYHLTKIDKDGNEIDEIPVPESMLGMAYDNTVEWDGYNGPFLWIFTGTSSYPSTPAIIKCIDIDSKELVEDFELDVTQLYGGGIAGGLAMTYLWDSSISVLMGSVQGTTNDYIFGFEVSLLVPPEHDVGVRTLLVPEDGPASADIIPSVLVKNYGNNSENTNVQYEIIKCEPGPPLLYENFSGSFPPTGWETDYWTQVNTNNAGGEPPEARCYKYTQYYAGDYYYNHIQSPPINCTGFEKVNVFFHFAIDVYYDNYVYCYLKYRPNATSGWKDLTPWDNPVPGDIEATLYEIGCYGWGEDIGSDFQLKFETTSYYYYFNYIYLDDVEVTGCAGCAEYADLAEYVDVPWDEEVVVEFEPWTPSEWHNPDFQDTWEEYPLTSYTILNDYEDENSRNDKRQRLLDLYYPWLHDVGTMSIEGPADGPAQTFPMEATIKNVGQYDECCFKTYAQVAEIDYTSQDLLITEDFYPYYTFPPTGWTRTNTKWTGYYSNYCGAGDYAEARFYYYPSETNIFRLYTPPIDSSAYGAIQIEWLNYLDHYNGPYTIKVETSPDGISWSTVWEVVNPGDMPAEKFTVVTGDNVGSSTLYVSWTFDGYSWNTNWWHIDNVVIYGFPLAEPEYEDELCISDIDQGDELHLVFDDWTPDFLSEETTGTRTYSVKMWTDMQDPPDNNVANDEFGQFIELQFFHDVGVVVSEPTVKTAASEMLWDNGDTDGSNGYSVLGSPRRSLLDDFELVKPALVSEFRCYMLYTSSHANDMELTFWTDDDGDPGEEMFTVTSVDFSEEATGRVWFGYPEYEIDYIFEEVKLPAGIYWAEGWLGAGTPNSFWMIHLAPLWGSECWINYDDYGFMPASNIFSVQADLSFQIWGKSGASVYIPLGFADIEGLASNVGTFPERDMTAYAELYEYYTDCDNPTLCYEDMLTGIDILQPLTGTKTLMFEDYNFDVEGFYDLQLEIEDDDDNNPANDIHVWSIGADGTPPSTTQVLDPPTPDGDNDWYVSDVEITLTATDPSIGCDLDGAGVREISYQVDGGTVVTTPGDIVTFVISEDSAMHTIKYWAVDNVGNKQPDQTIQFKQDQTAPVMEISYEQIQVNPPVVLITVNATDESVSGMDRVEFYLNDVLQSTVTGPGKIYEWNFTYYGDLVITVKGTAFDKAGNSEFGELTDIEVEPRNAPRQHSSNNTPRGRPNPR